jgi:hypothetical protein
MVIGNDVDEQLEPFWELDLPQSEIKGDPRGEFNDCTDEIEERWNDTTTVVKMPDGRMLMPWDEEFRKNGEVGIGTDTHEVPHPLKEEEIPTSEYAKSHGLTKDEWASDWFGYVQNEEGRWGYWFNPNAKWDWWSLGGRWSGYFKVKEGVPESNYILGDSGLMGSCRNRNEGRADQIRKGDIDIEGMRIDAEKKANEMYDAFERAVEGCPISESWETVRERYEDIKEARDAYHAQPMVEALKKERDFAWYKPEDFFVGNGGRAKYVSNAFCSIFVPFAILKDGKWYEKGEMGWWGMVSNEKLQYDWSAKFLEMFEELPDDTLISIIDCHI